MTSPQETPSRMRGLPVYVVLDTSSSMRPYQQLLNDTLADIYDTLVTSPQVMEFIHLSIMSFNTEPHVIVGITELDSLTRLPEVTCTGSTNYAPMFTLLRHCIDADVPQLSAQGINVLRPVVFLLTDGGPTDGSERLWLDALAQLTDPGWRRHAHILTWGFGDTGESVLRRVATLKVYLAASSTENRQALASALGSMLKSMVSSAARQQLQVPINVDGYITLDPEFAGDVS